MLRLLERWRFYLLAGGIAILVLMALVAYARLEHDRAKKARAQLQVATRQAKLNDATVKAVDHYTHTVQLIRERADAGVQSVQQAPHADDPVPDGVLDAWRDGIGRLRADDTPPSGEGS